MSEEKRYKTNEFKKLRAPFPLKVQRTYNALLGGLWSMSYSDFLDIRPGSIYSSWQRSDGGQESLTEEVANTRYRGTNTTGLIVIRDEQTNE